MNQSSCVSLTMTMNAVAVIECGAELGAGTLVRACRWFIVTGYDCHVIGMKGRGNCSVDSRSFSLLRVYSFSEFNFYL